MRFYGVLVHVAFAVTSEKTLLWRKESLHATEGFFQLLHNYVFFVL